MPESSVQQEVFPFAWFRELETYIRGLQIDREDERRKETLIQTLHKAQGLFGYLPEAVQRYIADRYGISHADVSGVISFYNYFTTTRKGDVQVSVCMGTACYVNGAEKVLREFERVLGIKSGQVTADYKFSLDSLRCVGACGLAPVVMIDDKVYGKVTPESVEGILEDYLVQVSAEKERVHA
jgi:NADH:ubiquinone oxidoreductase subunit E